MLVFHESADATESYHPFESVLYEQWFLNPLCMIVNCFTKLNGLELSFNDAPWDSQLVLLE